MGNKVSRGDFHWIYDDQPHTDRRKEMHVLYPQIKHLYGVEHHFKYVVLAMVAMQIICAYFAKDMSWWAIILLAYCFGGTINHSLTLAIHDISHNTAFGNFHMRWNRYFGMIANLPMGAPYSIGFKKYHIDHHRFLGGDVLDTDLPTEWEGRFFNTTFLKAVWLFLNPFFYALRPMIVNPKPMTTYEFHNTVIQMTFDGIIFYFWGPKAVLYLIMGTVLALGLHPVSFHFISEHYMFLKGHQTYSYYGSLNLITFNVGYHMEHHDFPAVPSSKLPLLKKIAPEYYNDIPYHTSWLRVLYDFIFDPAIGPYARTRKRFDFDTKLLVSKPETNGHKHTDEHIKTVEPVTHYEKEKMLSSGLVVPEVERNEAKAR